MVSVLEWQLLSFFEVEPQFPHDEPWPYTRAIYQTQTDDFTLVFCIEPADHWINIQLNRIGQQLYEFGPLYVQDVAYWNDCGIEALRIQIDHLQTFWLRLRPHLELSHKFENLNH